MLEPVPGGGSKKSNGNPLSWKAKLPAAVAEAPEGCTIVELQKKGRRNNSWKMMMVSKV